MPKIVASKQQVGHSQLRGAILGNAERDRQTQHTHQWRHFAIGRHGEWDRNRRKTHEQNYVILPYSGGYQAITIIWKSLMSNLYENDYELIK